MRFLPNLRTLLTALFFLDAVGATAGCSLSEPGTRNKWRLNVSDSQNDSTVIDTTITWTVQWE